MINRIRELLLSNVFVRYCACFCCACNNFGAIRRDGHFLPPAVSVECPACLELRACINGQGSRNVVKYLQTHIYAFPNDDHLVFVRQNR